MEGVFEMKQMPIFKGWRRLMILATTMCFYSLGGLGQNPLHKHFNTENGLIGNGGIFDIFQDSRNFIWIATGNGISKFNGYDFKNYNQNTGTDITLKFGTDAQRRVWALSFVGELTIFDGDSISDYRFNSVIRDFMRRGKCSSFYVDLNGTLHAGVQNGYFTVNSKGEFKWQLVDHDGFNGVCIQAIENTSPFYFLITDSNCQDSTYIYWLNNHLGIENRVSTAFRARFEGLSTVEINTNGQQQLVKVNESVLLFSERRLIQQKHFDFTYTHSHLDSRGQVWVSNPHIISGEAFCYLAPAEKPSIRNSGFKGLSVVSFLTDHEGGLWIGTRYNGLYYVPEPSIWEYSMKNELWEQDYVRSTVSFDDSLVIGSQYGLQGALAKGQMHVHNLDLGTKGSFGKSIVELVKHSPKQVLALFDYEIYHYNWQKPTRYQDAGNKNVISISASALNGISWVLGKDSIGTISKEGIKHLYEAPTGQGKKLFESPNGELYLAAYDGLWMLNNGAFENMGALHQELTNSIYQILFDNEVLWVVTSNGLFRLENERLFPLVNQDDFGKNSIKDIARLKDRVWANTQLGLMYLKQLRVNEYQLTPAGFVNGISNASFSFLGTHQDQLVLSRGPKITLLNPSVLKLDTVGPTLFLKGIRINDLDTFIQSGYSLNYKQNSIEFDIGTVNLRNSGNQLFEYQLIGFDPEVRTSPSEYVRYDYIPPGNYKFTLVAINKNSRARSKKITLLIDIRPPFWNTWWFITLSVLFVFGVMWVLIRMRFKNLLRKRDAEKRMAELESSALRAQMNPHFIFNVLGSIQAYILENNVSNANDYLGQFARLIRQTLKNSRSALISLGSEIQALNYYLQLERMRFDNEFDYSIEFDSIINVENFYIPPLLIQPYVENAIIHGISSLEEKGEVKIDFALTANQLICKVADNGVGISENMERDDIENQESVGMLVSKERILMLNTEQASLANVHVEDGCESGLKRGTIITITIPVFNTPKGLT